MIAQGDIWWAALPEPVGSGPGFHRPVVIVQGDSFNRSRIATVAVVPLTSNTNGLNPVDQSKRSKALGMGARESRTKDLKTASSVSAKEASR